MIDKFFSKPKQGCGSYGMLLFCMILYEYCFLWDAAESPCRITAKRKKHGASPSRMNKIFKRNFGGLPRRLAINRISKKEIPNRKRIVEILSTNKTTQTTESELQQGRNMFAWVGCITLILPNPSERGSELACASVKWHVFEPLSVACLRTTMLSCMNPNLYKFI